MSKIDIDELTQTETYQVVRRLSKTMPIHQNEIPDTQLVFLIELIDQAEKGNIKFKNRYSEKCFDKLLAVCLMNFEKSVRPLRIPSFQG
jgi:hypothetical protein